MNKKNLTLIAAVFFLLTFGYCQAVLAYTVSPVVDVDGNGHYDFNGNASGAGLDVGSYWIKEDANQHGSYWNGELNFAVAGVTYLGEIDANSEIPRSCGSTSQMLTTNFWCDSAVTYGWGYWMDQIVTTQSWYEIKTMKTAIKLFDTYTQQYYSWTYLDDGKQYYVANPQGSMNIDVEVVGEVLGGAVDMLMSGVPIGSKVIGAAAAGSTVTEIKTSSQWGYTYIPQNFAGVRGWQTLPLQEALVVESFLDLPSSTSPMRYFKVQHYWYAEIQEVVHLTGTDPQNPPPQYWFDNVFYLSGSFTYYFYWGHEGGGGGGGGPGIPR
ncbi:MAG: hypothetical protein ACFFCZ_16820 [Promethearchaeota archaeon]